MYIKNYECVILQVTEGALISAWKCTKKRLAAGLPPEPAWRSLRRSQVKPRPSRIQWGWPNIVSCV